MNSSRAGILATLTVTILCGCSEDGDAPVTPPPPPPPPPPPEWSTPTAVAPGGCPIESRDGNLLYTAAGPANTNGLDIWALRRNANNTYDSRTKLGDPVSLDTANDFCPTPLMGDWLMFVSTRDAAPGEPAKCGVPGTVPGLNGSDIFLTRYTVVPPTGASGTLQIQSMGPAKRLACFPEGPNTPGAKFSPSLLTTADGGFLYYSTEHNGTQATGSQDIYVSEMRPDGTYGPGVPVAALNTSFEDQQPNVSRDGLTIVFASNRGGNMDIYMATRSSLTAEWSAPRDLSTVLSFPTAPLAETRPSLSWDMKRLYFGADGQVYLSLKN